MSDRNAHSALGVPRSVATARRPSRRSRLAQARVGFISEGALTYICRRLDVPPAEAWGV